MMNRYFVGLVVLLLTCRAWPAHAQRAYAVVGTIVTARGVLDNGTMLIRNDRIEDIGTNVAVPKDVPTIKVDGVVFPGLIDLHNHLVWNVFPRWRLPQTVGNRYDWQALPEYSAHLSGPEATLISHGAACDMERYAEVKALLGGATSVVGSYGPAAGAPQRNECVRGLARNLDVYSGLYSDGLNAEPLRYEVFPFELSWEQAKSIRDGLGTRELRAVLFHVSEGKDASARREFRMLKARGFLRPGVSVIHGVALGESEFREMAANDVGLIWSPKSNLELYGKTADIAAAVAANVTISLAPDWSPTGSSGMLDELRVAVAWNREHGGILNATELLRMVTTNPARLAGVSDKIGALGPGMIADFLVLPKKGNNAIDALLAPDPGSIDLVVVGGKPLLGKPAYLQHFSEVKEGEIINVCGQETELHIRQDTGGETWSMITEHLTGALRSVGVSLAGLSECN